LCSIVLTAYYSGDQIEKIEMGGICVTCGREDEILQGFAGDG